MSTRSTHVHVVYCELYPNSCPEHPSYLGHPKKKVKGKGK